MPTLNGIEYFETKDSMQENTGIENQTATRVFQVAWKDRQNFVAILLGQSNSVANSSFRSIPQMYPDNNGLFCQETQSRGIGKMIRGAIGKLEFPMARITANYKPLQNVGAGGNIETVAWANEANDLGAEIMTLPGKTFHYSGVSEPLEQDIGKVMATIEKTVEYTMVPKLDEDTIVNCLGCVNSAVWRSKAAGTVLFIGGSASRSFLTTPSFGAITQLRPWHISFRFKIRKYSWNRVFRGEISVSPGADAIDGWWLVDPVIYSEADLNALDPKLEIV